MLKLLQLGRRPLAGSTEAAAAVAAAAGRGGVAVLVLAVAAWAAEAAEKAAVTSAPFLRNDFGAGPGWLEWGRDLWSNEPEQASAKVPP